MNTPGLPLRVCRGHRLVRRMQSRSCARWVSSSPASWGWPSVPAAAMADPAHSDAGGTVYVNCWHQAPAPTFSGYFVVRAHPRTCTISGSPVVLANENILRHLQWRSWGCAAATLTGQVRNTQPGMGGPLWTAVVARLSRIRRGCDGARYYTRITFPHSVPPAATRCGRCSGSAHQTTASTITTSLRSGTFGLLVIDAVLLRVY